MRRTAKGALGTAWGTDPARLAGLVARAIVFALCLPCLGPYAPDGGELTLAEALGTREPPEAAEGDCGGVFGRLSGIVHGGGQSTIVCLAVGFRFPFKNLHGAADCA